MFSSLTDAVSGDSDMKTRMITAVEPILISHWPKVTALLNQYGGAAAGGNGDELATKIAANLYPALPYVLRVMVSEDKFIALVVEHKATLMEQIAVIQAKQQPA